MDCYDILNKFQNLKPSGKDEWMAQCPSHHDENQSLHITMTNDGKLLFHCFAGCKVDEILGAAGLTYKDLPRGINAPNKPRYGLTLDEYANAKHLSKDFLIKYCGCADGTRVATSTGKSSPGVQMPYYRIDGTVGKLRWRMRMSKEQGNEPSRFVWDKNGDMMLYGLWNRSYQKNNYIIIVEGESDCQTLWFNRYQAFGLPGATNYKPQRDDDILKDYDTIYIHIEKDAGGLSVFDAFSKASPLIADKLRFFSLPNAYKDPSDAWGQLYHAPQKFLEVMETAINSAMPAETFRATLPQAQDKASSPVKKEDRRAQTSAENGRQGGRPATDYAGLVQAFYTLNQDDDGICKIRQWRKGWYQYDGRCYRRYEPDEFEKIIMNYIQTPEIGLLYHLQPTQNVCKNLLANLASIRYCGIISNISMPWWLKENKSAAGWIAMDNCLLDIETASINHLAAMEENNGIISDEQMKFYTKPLSANLLTTWALPYQYNPSADCPKFKQWLSSTLPDPEVQQCALMLMGLILVPDTSYNRCFFLSGEGGTGKSTFQAILESLVGIENVCSLPLLDFEDKFKLWKLADHLVNIVGEMPTDDPQGRLRYLEGLFKDTVSGGNISYEKKHENACEAKAIARHIFATNNLPVFFDKSEGIWDRLIIIPFTQRFRGTNNEIRNIKAKIIAEEMPGVLNLALTALAKLRQCQTFPEPKICADAKEEHRARCDFDTTYIKDRYIAMEGAEISVHAAYKDFCKYIQNNGLRPRSCPTLIAALQRYFGIKPQPRSNMDRTRVFKGIQANFYDEIDKPIEANF